MSDPVILAIVAAIPPTIAAVAALIVSLLNLKKIEVVHKATNSLTDRLVATTKTEAHAAGVKEEKEAQEGR